MAYARPTQPTVIVQISDPQMGFYHDNRDMEYETRTFSQAIEAVNRLHPDAVIFTGDYVHNPKSEAQWNEFQRIAAQIDPAVKILYVPGNHDVLRKEGSVDMQPYTQRLGADRFNTRIGNVLLTGFNTVYLKDETIDPSKEQAQIDWLTRVLKKRKKNEVSILFSHHPFFLSQINEPDGYSTISAQKRAEYFTLFQKSGVSALFSGHLHDCAEASYAGISMVTTSATGRQLGKAQSGVRIIVVENGRVNHAYYPLDEIPTDRASLLQHAK